MNEDVTLLDYFAAKAMAALIIGMSNRKSDVVDEASLDFALDCGVGAELDFKVDGKSVTWSENLASDAYYIAEAMIKEKVSR